MMERDPENGRAWGVLVNPRAATKGEVAQQSHSLHVAQDWCDSCSSGCRCRLDPAPKRSSTMLTLTCCRDTNHYSLPGVFAGYAGPNIIACM